MRQLNIHTGSRVDRIEAVLSTGYPLGHGDYGGNKQALTLGNGEHLTSANLCSETYLGHTRIFSVNLNTNWNRSLSDRSTTSNCTTYTAPSG